MVWYASVVRTNSAAISATAWQGKVSAAGVSVKRIKAQVLKQERGYPEARGSCGRNSAEL